MEKWMSEVRADDLPEPYRELTDLIGLEAVMKIADRYQGTAMYLPKLDIIMRRIRDEKIKNDFKEIGNFKELARKYGLTEVWIRQIVAEDENLGPTLLDFGLE
ncbi:Mor transcription activator family protein [Desulfotruncus alcoholivorax]|uniref:Mor transcription activator family protein n=1 Tax=Desulfotruncus alcoholivorax TaxID=265477 RepID=UPI000423FC7F|nr:Mor transcription activator family protein [Desulfotruncus alcoholivorax]